MDFENFQRKPTLAKAILVTEDNIEELAKFCNGRLKGGDGSSQNRRRFLLPEYREGRQDRSLMVYAGDWLVQTSLKVAKFKSFSDAGFHRLFMPVDKKTSGKMPEDGWVKGWNPET